MRFLRSIYDFFARLFGRKDDVRPVGKKTATLTSTVQQVLRIKPTIGVLIRITPGGRHGWFESNVGPLRKPLNN